MDSIGGVILGMIDKSMRSVKINTHDYEQDGLIYCGNCHTPKQKWIHIFDRDIKVGISCKCTKEKQEAEKKAREEYTKRLKIDKNRRCSGLTIEQQSHTFDVAISNSFNEKQVRYCRNYANKFDEMFKRSQGLLLFGPPGTGKSYLSACIANELLERGLLVKVTSTISVVGHTSFYNDDEHSEYIIKITLPDLLVLDDLGAERNTDFALERVHDIVEYRVASGKPMIVTTNYSLEQMKNETDIRKSRTYDRIFKCCFPMPFTGGSFRKQNANNSYADIKRMLEG